MSGSFTDDGNGKKLILCVAENGHSFEYECSETTSVESVMRFVESVSDIALSDQLLLLLDMRLEPQRLLSAFGLPASDHRECLFSTRLCCKATLMMNKLVDDCMSSQMSSSLRPHDAVSALCPVYEVHDKNHLPKMQACYNSVTELLDFCKNKKNEMNSFVHSYMQKITYVTYIIKDAKLQFPVFREAMLRQDDLFADLKLVRGVGPAYRACLAEAVRRKASMKLYMGMAGQLTEKLAMKRETEVRRRDEFLKTNGPFVTRDVLVSMGLYDTPTQCDVNVAPYDTGLIDIEIADVDRYAPECLVGGLHSKVASSRSSLGMSSDSSLSAETEEIG